MAKTTKQASKKVKKPQERNPTGKGGFAENPQNRSDGRWKAEDSISYQYRKLMSMTVEMFMLWTKNNPESMRTVAQELAYNAVKHARADIKYLKEVTDRVEGRAPQLVDVTSNGQQIVPVHGTGTTTELRKAMLALVKQQIKDGSKNNATHS